MPKHVSATDLLNRPRTQATSRQVDESSGHQVDESPSPLGNESTSSSVVQPPQPVGVTTYQKQSYFLTPDQKQWVKETARGLPDGLSASDLIRLAIIRLQRDVDSGLPLIDELSAQAHADATVMAGRRNRGLPAR